MMKTVKIGLIIVLIHSGPLLSAKMGEYLRLGISRDGGIFKIAYFKGWGNI